MILMVAWDIKVSEQLRWDSATSVDLGAKPVDAGTGRSARDGAATGRATMKHGSGPAY